MWRLAIYLTVCFFALPGPMYANNVDLKGDELGQVYTYKPNYFVFIRDQKVPTGSRWQDVYEVKFQFSLKVKIWDSPDLPGALYFGYTQKSFWDFFDRSAPFKSSNFNPEGFYKKSWEDRWIRKAQIGVDHESNGEDEPVSRGWNRGYAELKCVNAIDFMGLKYLSIYPKVWIPFGVSSHNKDIDKELSYGQLVVVAETQNQGLRLGTELKKESIQVDLDFQLWKQYQGFYFTIHYWYGKGERLLTYNKRTHRIGFGFSLFKKRE